MTASVGIFNQPGVTGPRVRDLRSSSQGIDNCREAAYGVVFVAYFGPVAIGDPGGASFVSVFGAGDGSVRILDAGSGCQILRELESKPPASGPPLDGFRPPRYVSLEPTSRPAGYTILLIRPWCTAQIPSSPPRHSSPGPQPEGFNSRDAPSLVTDENLAGLRILLNLESLLPKFEGAASVLRSSWRRPCIDL